MTEKRYYSARHGRASESPRLSFEDVRLALKTYFLGLMHEGYFQEHLGHSCVDTGFTPGLLGGDPSIEIHLTLGKAHLWPIGSTIDDWSEDDLFDMVEFLHANVSKPTQRHWHAWNQCGWHCTAFDQALGQREFHAKVNQYLRAYDSGFELSLLGEVLATPPSGLDPLLEQPIEHANDADIVGRVKAAVLRFRRHRASEEDRRTAVRQLADVLEFLRPDLKDVLSTQDERDLFNIANNFGIRHHNSGQRTNYDPDIWLDWIFYFYLATIGAATRLMNRHTS